MVAKRQHMMVHVFYPCKSWGYKVLSPTDASLKQSNLNKQTALEEARRVGGICPLNSINDIRGAWLDISLLFLREPGKRGTSGGITASETMDLSQPIAARRARVAPGRLIVTQDGFLFCLKYCLHASYTFCYLYSHESWHTVFLVA